MKILDRVRRINRDYLNPLVHRFAGRSLGSLLLRHHGRVSGRAYDTPLVAERTANGFVIPLTYGERADWAKNVMAAGRAEIRRGGVTYMAAGPAILDERVAMPLLSPLLRLPVQIVGIKRFMTLSAEAARSLDDRPQSSRTVSE